MRCHEIVFEWQDSKTSAKGWIVINSLRGGAAAGGTRMRIGVTRNEVLSLAKTMEVKFTVAGPDIGGGKSGIDFDPRDPRKKDVLIRWYKKFLELHILKKPIWIDLIDKSLNPILGKSIAFYFEKK